MTAILVDRSERGRLLVQGADRVRFLQGMVTNDVAALALGGSLRAAMLTPKGRVVADLLIHAGPEDFCVTTEPELAAKVRETLDRFIVMDDVTLVDASPDLAEVGFYGPEARRAVGEGDASVRVLEMPLGVHVVGPKEAVRALEARLVEGGLAVRKGAEAAERLRIERGVTRYGAEISEETLPHESGLDDAVSLTKGCYIGQEPVARLAARGHVNKKIVGLVCSRLPSVGDVLATSERPDAGVVTSATMSDALGAPIALGYLHRSLWTAGTKVRVGSDNEGTVRELPFTSEPKIG